MVNQSQSPLIHVRWSPWEVRSTAVETSGRDMCAALTSAPAGAAEESNFQEGRIIQCFMYLRIGSAQDNHYAHPLDLLVYLDMNSGRVLDTWMYPDPPAIPQMKANYIAPLVQKERGFRTGAAMPFRQSENQGCLRRTRPGCRSACSLQPETAQTKLTVHKRRSRDAAVLVLHF